MHERQAIRDAIVAQLTGETDAGARIFKGRRAPMREHELPAIAVYAESETVDQASWNTAPRELKRSVTVAIEAWVSAGGRDADDLDAAFDDLALQIETAIDADPTLSDTVFGGDLASTEFGILTEGNRPMGCVHLEYVFTYHTDLRTADADAARDDFDTADVKVAVVPGLDEDDQAEDLITDIHE